MLAEVEDSVVMDEQETMAMAATGRISSWWNFMMVFACGTDLKGSRQAGEC